MFSLIEIFQFIVFFSVCLPSCYARAKIDLTFFDDVNFNFLPPVESVGCHSLWQLSSMINFQLTLRGIQYKA